MSLRPLPENIEKAIEEYGLAERRTILVRLAPVMQIKPEEMAKADRDASNARDVLRAAIRARYEP